MSGWIALSRDITEHPVFAGQPERLYVWVWMLGAAAWRDTKQDASGKTVTVKRGQFLSSYRQISKATGVGVKVIRNLFSRLQDEDTIGIETGTGRILVTICNYEKYQSVKPVKGTGGAQQGHSRGTQKKQENNITSSSNEEHTCEAQNAFGLFSASAQRVGWSNPQKLTPQRKRSILARLKECGGLDGWGVALAKAEASDFISSQNWFGLDWLVKPANFTKLMEGNYDNRTSPNTPPRNTGRGTGHDSLMAGFAQSAHSEPGAGGSDFDGGETAFGPHDAAMGGWPDSNPSQPLLRVIGSE